MSDNQVTFSSPPLPSRQPRRSGGSAQKRWSPDEDCRLRSAVVGGESNNWKKIAALFPGRTAHQCLQRWYEVLRPDLVKGPWSEEEDRILKNHVISQGPRNWAGAQLAGRSSNQCKERWRKLSLGESKDADDTPMTPVEKKNPIAKILELSSPSPSVKNSESGVEQSALEILSSVCASLDSTSSRKSPSSASNTANMDDITRRQPSASRIAQLQKLPNLLSRLESKNPLKHPFLKELNYGFTVVMDEKHRRNRGHANVSLSLREIISVLKATMIKKQSGTGNFSQDTRSGNESNSPVNVEVTRKRKLDLDDIEVNRSTKVLKSDVIIETKATTNRDDTKQKSGASRSSSESPKTVTVLPAWAWDCDFEKPIESQNSYPRQTFRSAEAFFNCLHTHR